MSSFTYPDHMNTTITIGGSTGSSVYSVPSPSSSPTVTTDVFTVNGITTSPYNYNYNWNTISTGTGTDTITLSDWNNSNPSTLDVKGDANFEGDVKLKGKSLIDSLARIEEKLAILHPNEKLEAKWEQLRDLRKQYMELEKDIIEKEKVWEILNK